MNIHVFLLFIALFYYLQYVGKMLTVTNSLQTLATVCNCNCSQRLPVPQKLFNPSPQPESEKDKYILISPQTELNRNKRVICVTTIGTKKQV